MATPPLPNVRSKNIEKERRRVLKALAKQLDAAEQAENADIDAQQGLTPEAFQRIQRTDKKVLLEVRQAIAQSIDSINQIDLAHDDKVKEIQKTLDAWKNEINKDDTINPSVRATLFEYCDEQYRLAVRGKDTDTHTAGQFDPKKFKTKVKNTIYNKIANKITNLPGMGKIDAFLQFAGQETLSSKVNQKLGNVFNKGRSFSNEDAIQKEQQQKNAQQLNEQRRKNEILGVESTTGYDSSSEYISTSPRRAPRRASGDGGGVAAVGVDSTEAIRLLTDIRDILVTQFKFDQDKKKEDDQKQADAELAAEAASETPSTEPIRVDNVDMDEDGAPPKKSAGGGIVSNVVKAGGKKAATRVGGMLLQRIAPTAALSAVPSVAAASGTAAAAGGAAASGGMFAALSAGLSGLVAAIGPILLALAAVAGAVYLIYKIFKNVDFTPILQPLAKAFTLLKDVVSTIWPYFKALGKLIFTVLLVPFRMLGFVIGKYISLMLKLVGPVLGPVIDGFTWLWKNAIKPLMEGFTSLFTFITDVIENPWDFISGTGKFAKKETAKKETPAPKPQQQQTPTPTGRGAGPGPGAAPRAGAPPGRGPGPVGAPNSASGVLASLSSQMKGGYGGQATAGGATHAGVAAIAREVPSAVPSFNRFTGFNDTFHQEKSPKSLHTKGLAMDFTIHDPSKSPQAVAAVENIAKQHGVKIMVKDEYKDPSGHATAGHIHVQFPNEQEAQKMAMALGVTPDIPGVAPPPVPGGAPAGTASTPVNLQAATPASPASVSGVSGTRAATPIAQGTAAVHAAQTMAPAVTMVNALAPAVAGAAAPPAPMMIPIPVKARTELLFAYQTINAV